MEPVRVQSSLESCEKERLDTDRKDVKEGKFIKYWVRAQSTPSSKEVFLCAFM